MSRDPRSEFLVRHSNHCPSAPPPPKAVHRKGSISHHSIGGRPADSQFPLNFARTQQPILGVRKHRIDVSEPLLWCASKPRIHNPAPFAGCPFADTVKAPLPLRPAIPFATEGAESCLDCDRRWNRRSTDSSRSSASSNCRPASLIASVRGANRSVYFPNQNSKDLPTRFDFVGAERR